MQPQCVGSAKLYVAVVDDDESVCRSFSRLLRMAGFEPIAYASAEAFLGDTKRPRFDCLVLDIQLDGMSGLDLSQRLQEDHDTTPFIVITAYDAPEARSQALACGCAAYFRKTDPGALILDAIHQAVQARTGQRQHHPADIPT
jgi:FixJ family two-component response regulator